MQQGLKENYVSYNQAQLRIAVGHSQGFLVYDLVKGEQLFTRDQLGAILIVELLHDKNIIALVTEDQPNRLVLWDDYTMQIASQLYLNSKILKVKLLDNLLIVHLSNRTLIYSFPSLNLLKKYKTILPAADSVNAVSCLQRDDGTALIVLPTDVEGQIQIITYDNQSFTENIVGAHQNKIQCVGLSNDFVITASEKGTLLRVFTLDGQPKQEVRRGQDQVKITAISIHKNQKVFGCSSKKGTLHVFRFSGEGENTHSVFKPLGTVFAVLGSEWSFKQIALNQSLNQFILRGQDPDLLIEYIHERQVLILDVEKNLTDKKVLY